MIITGQRNAFPGASLGIGAQSNAAQDALGGLLVSELLARYGHLSVNKALFSAHANLTAPVIFTTAAGTGGPLIWNGSNNVNVQLLAVGFGLTVASTVAASLGITGNNGQAVAPTATTAIDSRANMYIGGPASNSTPYRVGTPLSAGNFFVPFAELDTAALTAQPAGMNWIDLGGIVTIPPGAWASIAASVTASTAQINAALVYAEVPI